MAVFSFAAGARSAPGRPPRPPGRVGPRRLARRRRRACSRGASPQHMVRRLGADDGVAGDGKLHRMQQERPRLRPPMPPWNEMSSRTRSPLELLVVEAVHHDVGDVGEAVGAQQVGRGRGRERRSGSSPSTRPSLR